MKDSDLLTMHEAEYKAYMKKQKVAEKETKKQQKALEKQAKRDTEKEIDTKTLLRKVARRVRVQERLEKEKSYREKINKIKKFEHERKSAYDKVTSRFRSTVKFKIPSRGIKIRRAEPQPQQKSYFKPVQQRSSYFGRTRI